MSKKKRFNHAFTVAFSLNSDNEGHKVRTEEIRTALQKRILELDAEGQWQEAVGMPYDTYCNYDEDSFPCNFFWQSAYNFMLDGYCVANVEWEGKYIYMDNWTLYDQDDKRVVEMPKDELNGQWSVAKYN